MNDVAELNTRHAIPDHLSIESGPGGLPLVRIDNAHASAVIALQGGQLLAWQPNNTEPVIWLSPAAVFTPGKSIRGGVPICWPWFGAHPENNALPAHGFARTAPWRIGASRALDDGSTYLELSLPAAAMPAIQWPHACELRCEITVGASLEMALITRNTSNHDITLGEALHTYFNVSDVRQVRVDGLDGCRYLDNLEGLRPCRQQGPVSFTGEVDRIYLDTQDDCLIRDPGLARQIRISKQGSASTVVWNPWIKKAAALGDMGEDGYLRMLCVESANAADDVIRLAAGAEHQLQVRYAVEPLDD